MGGVIAVLLVALPAFPAPVRPVATYSIVARDPATGELGVAVQSHWFSVGSVVSWAEAGVGAVATQSFVDPSYGPLGLSLMRAGRSAPDSLKALLAGDSQREVRQVGMVDAQGRAATHTGSLCIPAAGGQQGERVRRPGEPDGQAQRVARDGARVRGGERRPGRAHARGARRGRGRGRRHPRPAVGGARGGEGPLRAAGPGRTASSTCASRIIPCRSPSCGGWCACSAPTTT